MVGWGVPPSYETANGLFAFYILPRDRGADEVQSGDRNETQYSTPLLLSHSWSETRDFLFFILAGVHVFGPRWIPAGSFILQLAIKIQNAAVAHYSIKGIPFLNLSPTC